MKSFLGICIVLVTAMNACGGAPEPATPAAAGAASGATPENSESTKPALVELHLVSDSPSARSYPASDGKALRLEDAAVVSSADIESARAVGTSVDCVLKASAAKAFQETTKSNAGRRLAIVVDGTVASAPVIKAEIAAGHFSIDLVDAEAASKLAARIHPAP